MSDPAVRSHHVALGEVRAHVLESGPDEGSVDGPGGRPGDPLPVVLLHGWPQTSHSWRRVMALLPGRRVLAPDLRGLGATTRPLDGYDKQTVAGDVLALMDRLGLGEVVVVGHDMGGLVAWALATLAPERVRGLGVVDVTIPVGDPGSLSQGGNRWHHAFHRTPDLPEELVRGRERAYLDWFFDTFAHHPDAIDDADREHYAAAYARPGALRAGFAYYRAVPTDCEHNDAFRARGRLGVPVLAVGGTEAWGRGTEPLESLRALADDVEGGVIEDCGHFVPDEKPAELAALVSTFLDRIERDRAR